MAGRLDISQSSNTVSAWRALMAKAGVVIDYAPPLVDHVIHERHSLDRAFHMADTIRRARPTDEDAERATLGRQFQDAMAAVFEHETKSGELDAAFTAAYKRYFGPSKPLPKRKIAESIRCSDVAQAVYVIGHPNSTWTTSIRLHSTWDAPSTSGPTNYTRRARASRK